MLGDGLLDRLLGVHFAFLVLWVTTATLCLDARAGHPLAVPLRPVRVSQAA